MLYPFKFKPVYKNIIWGGKNIKRYFNRQMPDENIAESWELCCREDGMSIIENGFLKGTALSDLIKEYKEKILGNYVYQKYAFDFPLLIKIIDANDKLSVQVHPDDEYAKLIGEKNGKNELWYIIDAKKDASLVYGLKDEITKKDFIDAIEKGRVADTLNKVYVKPGDFLFIKAGTVHAILDGILIAEIQQNSNTTYRVYDWDRVDKNGSRRELHIERALDVINFNFDKNLNDHSETIFDGKNIVKKILESEYFNTYEINIGGELYSKTSSDSFAAVMNLKGFGEIHYDGGFEKIAPGDTLLLPACLGDYKIAGEMKLLVTYLK